MALAGYDRPMMELSDKGPPKIERIKEFAAANKPTDYNKCTRRAKEGIDRRRTQGRPM